VHVVAFPYFDIIKIRIRQPRLNFAVYSSHMLPRRLRWLAVLLYRSTTIYTNFLTVRTLFRVWSEDRLCPGLPSHLTATITEGVAGGASPLTRIPRVMLVEGGLFCAKGRTIQVTGVIMARQSNITSPVKRISDCLYVSGFEKTAHFVARPNFAF